MRVPPSWCPAGAPEPCGARHTRDAPIARPSSSILFIMKSARLSSDPEAERRHTEMLQAEVYALIQRSQVARPVPINAVGLGDYFKPELSDFLMKVSQLTGGVFIGR